MKKLLIILTLCFLKHSILFSANDIISVKSNYNVEHTTNRLVKILKSKNLKIFKIIDHSRAAKRVGQNLRPAKLIIFGNPKIGTKLMKCSQLVGLDLPLKVLIWEDSNYQTWISYHNPLYYRNRYNLKNCEQVLIKIKNALKIITNKAAH